MTGRCRVSVWDNRDNLIVGGEGIGDTLTIAGGSVLASLAVIGDASSASNNVIQVNSGSLFVTNAAGNGTLYVSAAGGKASLIVNGGSVTVDTLMATSGTNSVISLNGGTLAANSAFIDNDQDFVVGGAFIFNNGTITAHQFVLTNGPSSIMPFPEGLIQVVARHDGEQRPAVCGR